MKRITKTILGLLLSVSLSATAAYAQNPTSQPTPSPVPQPSPPVIPSSVVVNEIQNPQGEELLSQDILEGLETKNLDRELWLVLGLTITAGVLGGLVSELLSLQGNIEKPHLPSQDEWAVKFAHASYENVIDLGVLSRLIIGGLAAPPAMLLFRPETAFALLTMSVVAGSAGTAIFRSLQDRLKVVVAEKEKDEAKAEVRKQLLLQNSQSIHSLLEEAIAAFKVLEAKVIAASTVNPEKPSKLQFTANTMLSLSREDFENVWTPLNEIKGIEPQVVSSINNAFAKLQQEICKIAESRPQENEFTFKADSILELELFNQVRKLLNEANGKIEAIEKNSATFRTGDNSDRANFSLQPALTTSTEEPNRIRENPHN